MGSATGGDWRGDGYLPVGQQGGLQHLDILDDHRVGLGHGVQQFFGSFGSGCLGWRCSRYDHHLLGSHRHYGSTGLLQRRGPVSGQWVLPEEGFRPLTHLLETVAVLKE